MHSDQNFIVSLPQPHANSIYKNQSFTNYFPFLTSPDIGAGSGVGQGSLVDVDEDAGVAGLVRAGELDAGGGSRAAAGDLDLEAGHVELGATLAARAVQSKGLGADEVVASSQSLGDCVTKCQSAVLSLRFLCPLLVRVLQEQKGWRRMG